VYLPDLANKIGFKMPATRAAQKLVWQNYCIAILTPLQKGCDKIRPNCTLLKWRGV